MQTHLNFVQVNENIHVKPVTGNKGNPVEVAQQQEVTVSGKVIDDNGEPLPGATITVVGTMTGTITDIEGNYSITVPDGSVLVFSFIGYEPMRVAVDNRSQIDVTLQTDMSSLEEVVVVGYNTERKRDLLGAVSTVDMKELIQNTNPDILQALQGRVAGVFIDVAGDPGQGARVRIRGNNTLGNNDPLYIIDGVPLKPFDSNENGAASVAWGLSWLNPNDIESIQVLKDASAASIYGSRASNGVVIITTKQPMNQKAKIEVNARFGVETWRDFEKMANSEDHARIKWQAAVNDGTNPDNNAIYTYDWHLDPSLGPGIQGNGVPVLDRIIYPEWLDEKDQLRPSGHPNSVYGGNINEGTNWFDEISQTGIVQNYDVNFSQGSESGGVQLSLNAMNQRGVVINTNYTRLSLRLNSNYKFINNRLTIGENLSIGKGERQWMDTGIGGTPLSAGYNMKPILPIRTEDGRFAGNPGAGFSDRDNGVAKAYDNRDDRIHDTKIFGNMYIDFKIIEGFSFKSTFGFDYDNIFSRDIWRTFKRGFLQNRIAELNERQTHQFNWVFNNTLTYTKSINKHNFTLLAGSEAVKNTFKFFSGFGRDFAIETNEYFELDAASGEKNSTGSSTGFQLFSYFGKANYSYQDKYLASLTIRRDGSSRFGSDAQFAVFPAVSLGWRLGDEEFMSSLDWLSDLKFRVGWGQTGNQDIQNNARFGLYNALYAEANVLNPWNSSGYGNNSTSYDIGNNNTGLLPSGFYSIQSENQKLRWETTTEINYGVDFGFINNRLIGSFEYFRKNSEDILIRPVAIGAIGDGSARWVNGADMKTIGWEAIIEYIFQTKGDWDFSLRTNLSHYDDKITKLPEELFASYPGNGVQTILGRSPFSLFGYRTDGIFQNQEEVDSHADQVGKAIGQLRFKDLNGDGVVNLLDQDYQGINGRANIEYGFNAMASYKNFDLNLFFFGNTGRRSSAAGTDRRETASCGTCQGENVGIFALEAWTPSNTGSRIPALSNSIRPLGFSDFNIRNSSFLAFRQATLGYTLPQSVMRNIFLTNFRAFFTGDNLFWITDRKGNDPWTAPGWQVENNPFSGSLYPKSPRFTLGLSMGF
jgi:TonB-linked SusC/RagA family outer membrane protein